MVGRNSKVRRVEDLKGAIIGVSQYGSEADTFTRNALAMAGLKPDKTSRSCSLAATRRSPPRWPRANLMSERWLAWPRSRWSDRAAGCSPALSS